MIYIEERRNFVLILAAQIEEDADSNRRQVYHDVCLHVGPERCSSRREEFSLHQISLSLSFSYTQNGIQKDMEFNYHHISLWSISKADDHKWCSYPQEFQASKERHAVKWPKDVNMMQWTKTPTATPVRMRVRIQWLWTTFEHYLVC